MFAGNVSAFKMLDPFVRTESRTSRYGVPDQSVPIRFSILRASRGSWVLDARERSSLSDRSAFPRRRIRLRSHSRAVVMSNALPANKHQTFGNGNFDVTANGPTQSSYIYIYILTLCVCVELVKSCFTVTATHTKKFCFLI